MEINWKTGSGVASLVFAALSIMLIFFFFLLIVPFVNASYPSDDVTPALIMGSMWLGIFVCLGMGFLMGFFASFQKKFRGFAIMGTILNLLFLGVYLLGLKFLL